MKPYIRISQTREKKIVLLPEPEARFYGMAALRYPFRTRVLFGGCAFSNAGRGGKKDDKKVFLVIHMKNASISSAIKMQTGIISTASYEIVRFMC